MNRILSLIAGFFIGTVVACGGSSIADSGDITQAQVQAAIQAAVVPLQTQITTIQGELPHNLIVLHGTAGFGVRTFAIGGATAAPNATTATTFTATFLAAPTGAIFGMTQQIGITASNYLFISNLDGTTESAGLPVTIFYEALNCQGPAFTVFSAGISQANVNQGIVFGTGPIGDMVAADYLMLKAGQTPQPDFANSELQAIPGNPTCVNISPGPNNFAAAYPLVLNDPNVSKMPSGPYSPTTLGP